MEWTRFGGGCWGRELKEDDATDTRASDQFAATICIGARPRSSTESDAAPLLSAANACSDPLRITLSRARAKPNYRCSGLAAGRAGQRPRSGTSSAQPPRQPVGRIPAPCADRGVQRTIASLSAL